MSAALQVLGIGNAIVDVIAHADERFLIENGIEKGAMTLIDAERATQLYARMGRASEVSGGSAANTVAGLASFGGRAGFIGKVADDQLGEVFIHDIQAGGVVYRTPTLTGGGPTARCLILVTEDGQRSMNTYLGAAQALSTEDIDADLVRSAQVTYLEGYLFDPPAAREAFERAAFIAHAAGRKVAMTLSDRFCIERHREAFNQFIDRGVDILFANESEVIALTETEGFDEALHAIRGRCDIIALTRSAQGSVIVTGDDIHIIDAAPVAKVVDTTGAGDLYAAGFLFGLTSGRDFVTSGRLASLAAAEVISHVGPRPEASLKDLAIKARLI